MDIQRGEWQTTTERINALCEAGAIKKRLTDANNCDAAGYAAYEYSDRFSELWLTNDKLHPYAAKITATTPDITLATLSIGGLEVIGRQRLEISLAHDCSPDIRVSLEIGDPETSVTEVATKQVTPPELESDTQLSADIAEIGRIILRLHSDDIGAQTGFASALS
ncbi:hypothetical protein KC973_03335 [Candidatus Saccharibacteria bacterium]|nr:hypothetical protein [Candidatus Saccharibacteria bacterium]